MRRIALALLLAAIMLLSGCGYWAVEVDPVTVGDPVHVVTPAPTAEP